MRIFTLAIDEKGGVHFSGDITLGEAYRVILNTMLAIERQVGREEVLKQLKEKESKVDLAKTEKRKGIKKKLPKPPESPKPS